MSFKPTPSPNKVNYFKHFPHYFLRPYAGQLHCNEKEFLEKQKSKNCEWMSHPKIAMSEASKAILENWDIVTSSEMFDSDVVNSVNEHINSIHQSLVNLNNKDNTTTKTSKNLWATGCNSLQHSLLLFANFVPCDCWSPTQYLCSKSHEQWNERHPV